MTRTMVLYHGNCMDGFTAAWVCWRALTVGKGLQGVEYIPCAYRKPPPDVTGARVYIVDFSFPRDVLQQMAEQAERIVVLDHHKTAQSDLAEFRAENVFIEFDMERSGAMLTWDFFNEFSSQSSPWLVQYVQDRDLWRFALPSSEQVNAFIHTLPHEFEVFETVHRDVSLTQALMLGQGALAWQRMYVRQTKRMTEIRRFAGHDGIPVINAPFVSISEVVGELAQEHASPFAVGWHRNARGEHAYSLRSRGDFDVAELALRFGGGGHAKSAGFASAVPPWDLQELPGG